MDLYTKFVSTALFPLHERIKGHSTLDRFRELEKSQWADRADIEKFRNSRLQDFMVGIARDVVFYSDLFRNIGVDPRNIQRPTDLAMLPLLDKATVRANVEKLKSRSANGLARYNTGGSSGEPLVFFIGEARRSHDVAAKWRATRWWGWISETQRSLFGVLQSSCQARTESEVSGTRYCVAGYCQRSICLIRGWTSL